MARLLRTLRGADAAPQLAAAGLRGHAGTSVQSVETRRLPRMAAKPFAVLEPHHIDHVFASWYPADRRSDVLVVVDVSGSMNEPAPGTKTPLIRTVAGGCARLGTLLPNDARLALWEFGSRIDPPRDYRTLLPLRALMPAHRKALGTATGALTARPTGTGLYDTLLAAYLAARNSYRRGTPNQVVLFTDGLNQDDPGSISPSQLTAALKKANDPKRPVQLSVITFGQPEAQADALGKVLEPVDGNVEPLKSAREVDAMFIHVAAGGLEHGR
jgi:Mg-chelatase subunit ChlD